MSLDTIPSRIDGQNIDQTWFNVIRSVLNADFCPRSGGVVTDQAGNLGSSTYRWLYAYGLASLYYNGSRSIKVQAASGMSANYSIAPPAALPGANNQIVSSDSSGNLQTSIVVDNETLEVSGSTIRVKAGGITRGKIASLSPVISSSCGSFAPNSVINTFLDVTNLSVTLTSLGRPIFISLISDGSGNSGYIGQGGATSLVKFLRNNGYCAQFKTYDTNKIPGSSLFHIDPQPAGTYTYKVQLSQDTANAVVMKYLKLIAFET